VEGTLSRVGGPVPVVTVEPLLLSLHGPRSITRWGLLLLFEVCSDSRDSRADGDGLVNGTIPLLPTLENQSRSLLIDITGGVCSSSRDKLLTLGMLSEDASLLIFAVEETDVLGVCLNCSFVLRLVSRGRNGTHILFGVSLYCRNKISLNFVLGEHVSSPCFTGDVRLSHLVALDAEVFVPLQGELHLVSCAHAKAVSSAYS